MSLANNSRSFVDKLVAAGNDLRFGLTEPAFLRVVRFKHRNIPKEQSSYPLISVYIPTYNRCQILMERAVPSVLSQGYKNLELIIVGDHCTDGTEKAVNSIKDSRVRFVNLPFRKKRYPPTAENHWFAGPVVPSNHALSLVKGDWIARIDDDDTWTEDHVHCLLEFAVDGNYEFVSSSYEAERHGKRFVVDCQNDYPRIGGTQTWLYRSYLKFFRYNINCWRKAWNKVNDTDLQDRMYKAGVRMGFLDKITAFVLPRPGEVTVGLDAYKMSKVALEDGMRFER